MAVRLTESRLPAGLQPHELGQAVSAGPYALVSELASPLRPDWPCLYVVFVTDGHAPSTYRWRIYRGDDLVESEETEEGVYSWSPHAPGEYFVQVEIPDLNGLTLELYQRVRDPGEGSLAGVDQSVPLAETTANVDGHRETTRELFFDHWLDVVDAALDAEFSSRIVAAVLYGTLLAHPKRNATYVLGPFGSHGRASILERVAAELSGGGSYWFSDILTSRLGASQMRAPLAAMALGYTTWVELAAAERARRSDERAIVQNFENLSPELQVDVFNHLRFPRASIRLMASFLARLHDRPNRWNELNPTELLEEHHETALQVLGTEFWIGPTRSSRDEARPNAAGRGVSRHLRGTYITPHFPELQPEVLDYDGVDLARGHADMAQVTALQNDLIELGILAAGTPNGDFGLDTEWAVRELQIAMKYDFVARQMTSGTGATLNRHQARNAAPYGGPVDGVVNAETRRRIRLWKSLYWRCPVVVSAWHAPDSIQGGLRVITRDALFTGLPSQLSPPEGTDNIWRFNSVRSTQARMFAQDYSSYYDIPADRIDRAGIIEPGVEGFVSLGEWNGGTALDGQLNTPPKSLTAGGPVAFSWNVGAWPQSEIFPEELVGQSLELPESQEGQAEMRALRSTFRVVRAVSEQECLGYFDSLTAWDAAFESFGPCHWTLPLLQNATGSHPARFLPGEMIGFLALFKHLHPAAFYKYFGFFGIEVSHPWGHSDLRNEDEAKWAGWLHQQQSDGRHANVQVPGETIEQTVTRLNAFKSWPWFYRFQAACRFSPEMRGTMWTMARIRIRDFRAREWPAESQLVKNDSAPVTIGDVFTSERGTALVMRWHVKNPGQLFGKLHTLFGVAGIAEPNVDDWGDAEEQAMIKAVSDDRAVWATNDNYNQVENWPEWDESPASLSRFRLDPSTLGVNEVPPTQAPLSQRLRAARDSFHFAEPTAEELGEAP